MKLGDVRGRPLFQHGVKEDMRSSGLFRHDAQVQSKWRRKIKEATCVCVCVCVCVRMCVCVRACVINVHKASFSSDTQEVCKFAAITGRCVAGQLREKYATYFTDERENACGACVACRWKLDLSCRRPGPAGWIFLSCWRWDTRWQGRGDTIAPTP